MRQTGPHCGAMVLFMTNEDSGTALTVREYAASVADARVAAGSGRLVG